MKAVRLTMKDTGTPIWINVDRIAAIEAPADGGSSIIGVGLSAIDVEEFPSDIFDAMGQHR